MVSDISNTNFPKDSKYSKVDETGRHWQIYDDTKMHIPASKLALLSFEYEEGPNPGDDLYISDIYMFSNGNEVHFPARLPNRFYQKKYPKRGLTYPVRFDQQ